MASLMRIVCDWLESFLRRKGAKRSRNSDGYITLDGFDAQDTLNHDVSEKNAEKELDEKTRSKPTDNVKEATKEKKTLGTGLEWLRYMEGFSM